VVILVAGMHRTGSSALSGVLNRLGAAAPGELLPPSEDNRKGYFENKRIRAFHDWLLAELGSRWDDPLPLNQECLHSPNVLAATRKLRALFLDEFGDRPLVLVKDPRLCRLLPVWIAALEGIGRTIAAIFPCRYPLDVAASLQRRDSLSRAHALSLWLQHVLTAEHETRKLPRSFVIYDDLLQDWRSVVKKTARTLGLAWPQEIARVADEIDAFLSIELRHHQSMQDASLAHDSLERFCLQAWDALKILSAGESDEVLSTLDDVGREFHGALRAMAPLLGSLDASLARAGRQLTKYEEQVENYKQRTANLEQTVADYKSHTANMEQHQKDQEEHAANLLADYEHRTANLEQTVADYKLHTANMKQHQKDQEEHATNLERRISEQKSHLADKLSGITRLADSYQASTRKKLKSELRKVAGQLSAVRTASEFNEALLTSELVKARSMAAALLESTSWRVTMPLRALAGIVPWIPRRGGGALADVGEPLPLAEVSWPVIEPDVVGALAKDGIAPFNQNAPTADDVAVVRSSGLFDEDYYAGTEQARSANLDPVVHYLCYGEAAHLPPGSHFDPTFYCQRYLDVAEQEVSPLLHYIRYGRSEGRSCQAFADTIEYPNCSGDRDHATVLVVLHEATRTGGVILGWNIIAQLMKTYRVVAIMLRDGPLVSAFRSVASAVVVLPDNFANYRAEMEALARSLKQNCTPLYAIANSAETRYLVPFLENADIPTIALLHEFSASVRPLGSLYDLFVQSSCIVFSAPIVADSALGDYKILNGRHYDILPQGMCRLPPQVDAGVVSNEDDAKGDLSLLPADDPSILVVGLGTITPRKGVEFFIQAAAGVARREPANKFTFAWVGRHYSFDQGYMDFCQEQVRRSGLCDRFIFLGEFSDLEPLYQRANLCFLSSRLDPLPNTAIDCMARGIPVVCFDKGSGIAEVLASDMRTQDLVLPYLDADAAAQVLAGLIDDEARRSALSAAVEKVAAARFDMRRYVSELDRLGRRCRGSLDRARQDRTVIESSGLFNPELYRSGLGPQVMIGDEVAHYLRASRLTSPRNRPWTGMMLRRPLEGFHPCIYAGEYAAFDETTGEDPLAHFLRNGRPTGRWTHTVIRPDKMHASVADNLRVALHGHFHYTELLPDFLRRLAYNRTRVDLVITTTSEEQALTVRRIVADLGYGRVAIETLPNRGRDIGALLNGLGQQIMDYDVIGHIHGKRSPHASGVGDRWREFLWEHSLGDKYPVIDLIVESFASDPKLGLVFPEDPHLAGWEDNREMAEKLAARMGWIGVLPPHFDFPIGNCFWARPAALEPLLKLGLTWSDYPSEPVPIDGTILHALERLTSFSAMLAGYHYCTTHIRGCTR